MDVLPIHRCWDATHLQCWSKPCHQLERRNALRSIESESIGEPNDFDANRFDQLVDDIDFYGVGFLAGLDAERQNACNGLLVYAKSSVSMLAGDWRADSRQTNQFGGGVIASRFEDFRLTPVLEGEVGAGWQSESGKVRLTGGFLASGWFNSISTRDYIQSFNEGNYVDMNDTVTFSGLVTRLELRR